jgi:hypothetical protein
MSGRCDRSAAHPNRIRVARLLIVIWLAGGRRAGQTFGMKIALCVPVHDDTKTRFTMSLVAMVIHSLERGGVQFQSHFHHRNSRIARAREILAEAALTGGADYILWLDADQTFPPDTLLRLLAHDLPFIGCNYRRRIPGKQVSASHKLVDGVPIGVEPRPGGIEPVDLLGFGVVLTKASMFGALTPPWFSDGPFGEDGYFSQQAAAAGFQPHIDHAIKVGHISEVELRFET